MNQPQTDTPKIIQIMLMPNDATHKVLPPAAKGTIMSKEIEKLVPVGQPCLVVPLNLWLQWNGDGDPEDSGDVAESEVTWSREKIFDADVEYVHADEIRRALMGHRRSELWGDNGLIAATMRCVHGYEDLEDQIAAVTKERDELKEQLVYYKANNPKGYAAANRYREQRDTLAEALRQIKSELGVPQPEYPAPIANAVKIADEALAAVKEEAMSDQPRTLHHNGVGEADMETPEEYARLMGQASNQTIVPSEIEGSGEGSGGHVSKFSVFYSLRNLLFRGIRGLF